MGRSSARGGPRAEGAGIHLGAGAGAGAPGVRWDETPPDTLDAALEAPPRSGLTVLLREAFASGVRRKPRCATAAPVRGFGFLDLPGNGPGGSSC
ncbi:hypothetical protein C2142_30000 [Streptomyces sp. CB01881]|nr:hypothetical protein C2142_30000 [Streptomyces sp. CB01881]